MGHIVFEPITGDNIFDWLEKGYHAALNFDHSVEFKFNGVKVIFLPNPGKSE